MRFFCYTLLIAVAGCQGAALTAAKLYLQEEQTAKAKEQLEQALVVNSENPEAHFLLGKVHALQENYAAMAASLDRSLELSPKFGGEIATLRRHYWSKEYNRGITLAMADQPDYAIAREAFQAATIIDPQALQSWRNLAFTHYQLQDLEAAIAAYQQLGAMAPEDTSVFSSLGALCVQEKRYEEAAEALSHLVGIDPGNARAHVNLGIAYEQLDKLAEAEAAFVRAVELEPQEVLAHYGMGNFYWNREQYEKARDAYARAVELTPEDVDARFNLAMTYLRLEDDDGALPQLEQLAGQQPDNGVVWRQLSYIYARKDMGKERREADAMAKSLGY